MRRNGAKDVPAFDESAGYDPNKQRVRWIPHEHARGTARAYAHL